MPWASPKDLKTDYLEDTQDHISCEAAEAHSTVAPLGATLVVVRGMILAKDVPMGLVKREMAFNQDVKAIIGEKRAK